MTEAIRILPNVGRVQNWDVLPSEINPFRSKDRTPWLIGTSDAAHKKFRIYSKTKGTWVENYDNGNYHITTHVILSTVDIVDEENGICTTTHTTRTKTKKELIAPKRAKMETEAIKRMKSAYPNQDLYLPDDVQFHMNESLKDKSMLTPEMLLMRAMRSTIRLILMSMKTWTAGDINNYDPINGPAWPV